MKEAVDSILNIFPAAVRGRVVGFFKKGAA